MKRQLPKQKAIAILEKHGVQDSMKNVLQIIELIPTGDDKIYWYKVKSYLELLYKEAVNKEKEFYNTISD